MLTTTLPPPGYAVDPATGVPTADLFPGSLRLLTPFLNVTGGLSLLLGAIFSAYVFMPKRRVLEYSLDPNQKGDEFLFNLLIAPVAITVNFVASLPGAFRALVTGKIHSRVPATILIAIGAFMASSGDTLLPLRDHRVLPARQVPGGRLPLPRLPRSASRSSPSSAIPFTQDRPRAPPAGRARRCPRPVAAGPGTPVS